jgi:DNA adenine methylase
MEDDKMNSSNRVIEQVEVVRGNHTLSTGQLHSPFRYPGGKYYARKFILATLPPHDNYCEPFCGGASIFFAKPKCNCNVLNDLDTELMNTYRQIQHHAEDLIAALDGIAATKENHRYFKLDFKPQNDLQRAMRWFFLNRTSYSGIMRPDNCYWGYSAKHSAPPERWPALLRKVSLKLQGVQLANMDFQEVIESVDDDCFLFLDPPYYGADQEKIYSCTFNVEDHERLLKTLVAHRSRVRFLLTYDDHPEVWRMYGGWCQMSRQQWTYTMHRTDDQAKKLKLADGHKGKRSTGKEVFITNYGLASAAA